MSRIKALVHILPLSPKLPLVKGIRFPEIPIPSDALNVLLVSLYINLAFAPDISKPPPSACAEFNELEANTIILSLMSTTLELIVVVVPRTCKLPLICTSPVLFPWAAGSIVNDAGVYKVEPPNITLPDTFKLTLTSTEPALKLFTYMLRHRFKDEPKSELMSRKGSMLPLISILVTLISCI